MYADPAHIRDNIIKVRLNDPEHDVFMSLARLNERQPSPFLRELALLGLSVLEQRMRETDAA